jgi:hypothetical protein
MRRHRSNRASVLALAIAGLSALALLPGAARAAAPLVVSRADGRHGAPSAAANWGSIDGRGQRVVFLSAGLGGRPAGIYVRDVRSKRTRRLGEGSTPVIDAAGDRVAFGVDARVYALDLRSGRRILVSAPARPNRGKRRGGISGGQALSGSGRYVAFTSTCPDLLRGAHGPASWARLSLGQVYVRDLILRRTVLVSRAAGAGGAIGDGESSDPSISAGGRLVAFTSEAGNLIPGHGRSLAVYVRDLRSGSLRLVSDAARNPSLSADGRYVAFELGRFGRPEAIVVKDLRTGASVDPTRFSRTPIHVGYGSEPVLSPDGRFLAFRGGLSQLGLQKLYVVDLRARRVRIGPAVGTEGETRLAFSRGGRFLVFDDYVQNVPGRESGEPVTESGEVYRLRNPFVTGPSRSG